MNRLEYLRSKLKPLDRPHVVEVHVWMPAYNRSGRFRGLTFQQWLDEEVDERGQTCQKSD